MSKTAVKQISDERAYDVIVSPHVTEKSTALTQFNQYVFVVSTDSNKQEIKQAVQKLFKVEVVSVQTILQKGKTKNWRGIKGRRKDVKKAVVRLKEGQTIDLSSKV